MAWIEKSTGDVWNPTKTTDEKGNKIERTVANENDFIVGWYIGLQTNKGQDGNSNIYEIMADDGSFTKSVWGSTVLNDKMREIPVGSFIKIQWTGKEQPKTVKGRTFHNWKVFYDREKGLHPSIKATQGESELMGSTASVESPLSPKASDLPF